MSYIATISDYINQELTSQFLKCSLYDNKMIIGLAQQLPIISEEDKIELIPSYVNNSGQANYIGPDDDFDIIMYHRCTLITVGKAALPSFGDTRQVDGNIARMSLIVFGRRDRLHLSNVDIAINIQAAFPQAATKELLKQLDFRAANINISEIILNDLQVFTEEFQNVPFFLKPEQFLFKINYTIESAFLKECFINGCE